MKKQLFFLAVAALALASCSSENDVVQSPAVQETTADDAVNFDAYLNRGVTRAGVLGTLTTAGTSTNAVNASLQDATVGFGVFGYYTNGEPYSENAKPDFFYNQNVYYNAPLWTYTPVKYWPNEFGQNAISTGQDMLTFFAYAPYVEVNVADGVVTGDKTSGIVALTRNTAHGDPYVTYYASMNPDTRVDLCYGVSKYGFTSSVDDANSPNSISIGQPYINVIKPKTADRISFDFKHALASLNVQIDADIDDISHSDPGKNLDGFTKIWVREVKFKGFAIKGKLNLNSNTSEGPRWYELTGDNRIGSTTVAIYDGRTNGAEGKNNASATNEKPNDLNTKIVQSLPYDQTLLTTNPATELKINDDILGVQHEAVNLFNSTTPAEPILVIPTGEALKITIVYDVETYDPNLPTFLHDGVTRGSSIQNTIEKEIELGGTNLTLEPGKAYIIKLHLGMTSVKFEASVTDWVDGGTGNTDLPYNTRSIYVTPSTTNVTSAATSVALSAKLGDGVTDVILNNNTCVGTMTLNDGSAPATISPALLTGTNFAVPANDKVYNKVFSFKLTGVTHDGATYESNGITINQGPAALGLNGITRTTSTNTELTLTSTGKVSDWTNATFTITVNGGALDPNSDFTIAHTDETTATITILSAISDGDPVVVTVTAGDAASGSIISKGAGTIEYSPTAVDVTVSAAGTPHIPQTLTTKTGDGEVTYSISKVSGTGTASIDLPTGVVTFTNPTAGDKFTVTATVDNSENYNYATKTSSYTITIIP